MPTKRHKYQDYLNQFLDCPPKYFQEVERKAFRWVFDDCDEESFKPALILNPLRNLVGDTLKCLGYSLSLFNDKESALAKYQSLVKRKASLVESLGNKIAEFDIDKKDGVCSEPELQNFSHFSIHEYEGIDLSKKRINIVEIFDSNGDFKR